MDMNMLTDAKTLYLKGKVTFPREARIKEIDISDIPEDVESHICWASDMVNLLSVTGINADFNPSELVFELGDNDRLFVVKPIGNKKYKAYEITAIMPDATQEIVGEEKSGASSLQKREE